MKKIFWILSIIAGLVSCNDRETLNSESVLVPEIKNTDELDRWLYQTYTQPYNIEVKYRWDANVSGLNNAATPPSRAQVKPVMEAVHSLWLQAYENIAGTQFVKQYAPKEIYVYGDKNLDSEGYEQMRSNHAHGQMPLYRVNEFSKSDSASVVKVMRMAHHQFVKALIQSKPFDKEAFSKLNFNAYSETWGQTSPNNLYDLTSRASDFGYYSLLAARGGVEEDFAETVSALLCNTRQEVDYMIYSYAGYEDPYDAADRERAKKAVKTLTEKRAFVIKYFNDNFGINFNRLHFETNVKLKTYLK
ncbi:putative zinc-binding metallopeptidase [Riemerella anatipestifer]|uniref:putative zinc-binding metallopeptidase n=1 Tax=Riemerella anatipestifer TaxID=34085 RepID=UPI0021F8E1EF|nr:putative zinc-binding metallopeptidase [Riemerella anatipestifer]MCW0485778.1 putative zinc-binding metallopeptidase [Riemerella anatipestifer]WKV60217.1 putative zinc-binding metallopeptidase [Riemerella anatipestifer]